MDSEPPKKASRGYRQGELRGAFFVELDSSKH